LQLAANQIQAQQNDEVADRPSGTQELEDIEDF